MVLVQIVAVKSLPSIHSLPTYCRSARFHSISPNSILPRTLFDGFLGWSDAVYTPGHGSIFLGLLFPDIHISILHPHPLQISNLRISGSCVVIGTYYPANLLVPGGISQMWRNGYSNRVFLFVTLLNPFIRKQKMLPGGCFGELLGDAEIIVRTRDVSSRCCGLTRRCSGGGNKS